MPAYIPWCLDTQNTKNPQDATMTRKPGQGWEKQPFIAENPLDTIMTKRHGHNRGMSGFSCFRVLNVQWMFDSAGRSEDFWGDKRPVAICLSRPEWNEDHEVRRDPCIIGVKLPFVPNIFFLISITYFPCFFK